MASKDRLEMMVEKKLSSSAEKLGTNVTEAMMDEAKKGQITLCVSWMGKT